MRCWCRNPTTDKCQRCGKGRDAQLYQEFYRLTPVKSGNAKQNTKLVGNTIEADYPYAQVLDDGRSFRQGQMRGSTQAPQGMTKPTMALMNTLVQAQIAKANKNG